ncbi:hypothetical protein EH183_42120 [Streptomyces sp. CB01881]|nr:hypothetical protein EH183_42120 [Streptomyces sp. CB01881]
MRAGPAESVRPGFTRATPSEGRPAAYLVRMLHNEKKTAFKSSCKPVAEGSYFYGLDELRHCLAHG